MHRIAIVINSRFGQTEKIALWLKQRLAPFCAQVHVHKIIDASDSIKIDLNHYDLVIIGAPVYGQRFSMDLVQWAKTFSAALHTKMCVLYTVSGNAGDLRPEARAADDMLLKKFMNETGLNPTYVASFGGAIHYTKYNFLMKLVMRAISRRANGSTDTTRDLELTNWNQVDAFVHAILDHDGYSPFAYNMRFPEPTQFGTRVVTQTPASIR